LSKSFDEIRRLKKPNEVSVELLLDPDRNRTLEELQRRYEKEKRRDAKTNEPDVAPGILKQIEALQEEMEEDKVVFVFRDPGRKKFEDLVETHPPSDEQKKDDYNWDPEGFIPALLTLCAIDPKLSEKDSMEIYDEWGRGDVEALFNAALQVCLEQASIPFTRRDIEGILASAQSSTTAASEESPTDTS
jgi:hypothetical protein